MHFLIPCFRAKGFAVEAIWGFSQEVADETARALNVPFATDNIDTLLLKKEVQLICVACPPHLHMNIVSKAFNIGKHVMCDWPAALSPKEIREMVEKSCYYPSLISILCHPLRFLTAFQQMKKLIHSSDSYLGHIKLIEANIAGDHLLDLGDLYTVKCDHYMGGGLLTNVGSHIIDIIAFLTNCRAKRAHGIVRTFCPDISGTGNSSIRRVTVDDFCSFQLELDTKQPGVAPLALVTINSHVVGQFKHEIVVYGTRGYLAVREGSLYGQKYAHMPQSSPSKSAQNGTDTENVLYVEDDDELCISDVGLSDAIGHKLPSPYVKGTIKLISTLRDAFQSSDSPLKVKRSVSEPAGDHDAAINDVTIAVDRKPNNNDSEKVTHWVKDAVSLAANFEDGEYVQAVIEAIKQSSERREWLRVKYNVPFGPQSPKKLNGRM